jgi:hypothetical protein
MREMASLMFLHDANEKRSSRKEKDAETLGGERMPCW